MGLGWADFEDGVCAAAAELARCDAIVSRNAADFPASPVGVRDGSVGCSSWAWLPVAWWMKTGSRSAMVYSAMASFSLTGAASVRVRRGTPGPAAPQRTGKSPF